MISLSSEIQQACNANRPVVALESTIITHGMPYPENLQTAKAVEACVRDEGAIPATIAVIDGELKAGLSEQELSSLAQTNNAMKLSRADLAFAIAAGSTGSTTVAATMLAAHLAGINVFATGGIGGVHKGAEKSFDISADLQELRRTPVTVVCAGAKAILDIPKTLEVLETLGVPVVAFGQSNMPAFWSADSGIKAPLQLNSPAEIVRFIQARLAIGIDEGMLIANPVPSEYEIPKHEMDTVINKAIAEADEKGISGKSVTPWLLGRIVELTDGNSLLTNQSLIKNNARLAAQIAVDLATARSV